MVLLKYMLISVRRKLHLDRKSILGLLIIVCIVCVICVGRSRSNYIKTNTDILNGGTDQHFLFRNRVNSKREFELVDHAKSREDFTELHSLALVKNFDRDKTTGSDENGGNNFVTRSSVDRSVAREIVVDNELNDDTYSHYGNITDEFINDNNRNDDNDERNRKLTLQDMNGGKENRDRNVQGRFKDIDGMVVMKTPDNDDNYDNGNLALENEVYRLVAKLKEEDFDTIIGSDIVKSGVDGDDDDDDDEEEEEEEEEERAVPYDPWLYPQRVDLLRIVDSNGKQSEDQPINKWKYTPIVNPNSKCTNGTRNIFLLYVVKTSPGNFKKRKTLRRTWANEKIFSNIRTVFSIGLPRSSSTLMKLKSEALEYRDILLMDYMDTYNNLTLKTISSINWAVAFCDRARFVVSVDDDMYVATDFLIKHLEDLPPAEAERLYLGHVYTDTSPVRNAKENEWEYKWIISKEEYAFSTYPKYIFGGFVVMSMRTVTELCLAIPYTKLIKMEDVYLGIVASRLGIVPTNTDLVDSYVTYANTRHFKTVIASHFYTSALMLENAWECHLSIVNNDTKRFVFCLK